MGFWDFFRKKKRADQGPSMVDLALDDLVAGCMVDYDLKTWEVTARHVTDWGGGDKSIEWQLKSYDDVIYLEKTEDDEVEWCISRKADLRLLGPDVPQKIIETDDPPETVTCEGLSYYLEESGGGHFYKNGTGEGLPMLMWDYEDDSGRRYLTIEQWGEEEFELYLGEPVESYQFTNILPPHSS